MNTADKLEILLGSSMAESLGVRSHGLTNELDSVSQKVIAMHSPDDGKTRLREAAHIDVERIIPDPRQPRKVFPEDSIEQMAQSLKTRGQLQPIRVRWSQELQSYIIISGERRYRGAQKAGLKSLACIAVEGEQSESDLRIDQLVENLLREDLRPIEAAKSYKELMELNNWTVQQLADSLKVAKSSVSRTLSMLELPEDIQGQVEAGKLAPSVAYEVSKLNTVEAQRELVTRIIAEGLKRDEVMNAVTEAIGKGTRKSEKGGEGGTAPKTALIKRQFKAGSAKVVITWTKKTVRNKDVIVALEAALAAARGPADEPAGQQA